MDGWSYTFGWDYWEYPSFSTKVIHTKTYLLMKNIGELFGRMENGPVQNNDKTARGRRRRQALENCESNDSPEIPVWRGTSGIPGLPSGAQMVTPN